MRLILSTIAIVVVMAWRPAAAQLYQAQHRPVDVRYRQFATDHFWMIYQRGLEGEARELAGLLERTLPRIRAQVGLRRELDVPVVLNRFTDRANGFVTPRPLRQEIDAVPLRGNALSRRFRNWFETVGPHELVHAAHAESGHGVGIGWLLRRLGPDLARSLNLSGPRGINEGLAVWLESNLWAHAGRLNHSFFEMEFRAAMDSDRPWSLTQMLEPPAYTRPFDRYYNGGAHLFQYLENGEDVPFFRRAQNFYYRMPLLGYGPALWYGTGRSPRALGREVRRAFRRQSAAFMEARGELTPLRTVATERGTVHRRPRWLDNHTLLAYLRGYHLRPGFYRIDLDSGARRLVAVESITEDMMYTLDEDRTSVLFSRYVFDPLEALRATADVFHLSLATGESERVTESARLFAPVRSSDGTIWALRNVDRFNEWVRIAPSGEAAAVDALDGTQLLAVEPDPSTLQIAVLANRGGRQGIYRAGIEAEGILELEPWLQFENASIYDLSWSGDGRYLLFTADPGGVANVFCWQRDGDRVYQLTNVPYGALEPALSPDNSTVVFVNYRHERYDLAAAPFDLSTAREWPRADVRRFSGLPRVDGAGDETGRWAEAASGDAYRPLLHVRPRVVYPFIVYQRPTGNEKDAHLGFGGGMGVEWSDPLQYWTAHSHLFYQANALWGRALLQSGRQLLRPSAEIFRAPSTVIVRRVTQQSVDTVRVGKDERGIGAAVRLPAVLASNVYTTTAAGVLGVQYRTERLFGRDGETIRESERRVTLRPSASLAFRMQSNARDIQPSSGLSVSAFSAVDVWSEGRNASRWLRGDAELYVPIFRRSSTAVKFFGGLLDQNRGGQIDVTHFLPRGYETENVFLDRGTFVKSGMEITRPLWYVDDGFLFPPVYLKAIFAYGFLESMGGTSVERLTVAGAGLGLQVRLFHGIDVTLRAAPVYRFSTSDWSVTFR